MNILRTSILCALMLLSSCARQNNSNKDSITVTIEPLRYFVEQIAGDDFDINVVVPSGANPENYEPTPSAMRAIADSKLFIAIGMLEPEFNIINAVEEQSDVKYLPLKKYIDVISSDHHHHDGEDETEEQAHGHSTGDPHFWTSTTEAYHISSAIFESLCKLNPDSSEKYFARYQKFTSRLDSLDTYIRNKFSTVNNPEFMIYHPALAYYCRDYDIKQTSIEIDGKEPSVSSLGEFVEHAKSRNIVNIFYQKQLSSGTVDAISRELGGKSIEIDPLAYDWYNNMISITDKLAQSMQNIK